MVFVEYFLSLGEISYFFGLLFPRYADQPVDVRARDRSFGRHRRHRFQPVQFLERFFLRFFGHAGLFDLLFQLVEFGSLILAAKLFVDGLDLLVEVILLLRFFHLALNPRLDGAIELPLLELNFEDFD